MKLDPLPSSLYPLFSDIFSSLKTPKLPFGALNLLRFSEFDSVNELFRIWEPIKALLIGSKEGLLKDPIDLFSCSVSYVKSWTDPFWRLPSVMWGRMSRELEFVLKVPELRPGCPSSS